MNSALQGSPLLTLDLLDVLKRKEELVLERSCKDLVGRELETYAYNKSRRVLEENLGASTRLYTMERSCDLYPRGEPRSLPRAGWELVWVR